MDAPAENFAKHDVIRETGISDDLKQRPDDDLGAGDGEIEKRWPGWPGDSVFRILVPAQKVGSIIGRKGEYIKRMCEESKARIKILDGPPGVPERAVIISAKEEQDSSISPAIDGLLRVHKRIVDGLDGEVNQAPPSSRNMVPTRLLVAATQAGTLIGKQGATIKSIQEASNSAVRILDELPPVALQDDRVVEIQGEPTAMHTAVELIAGHLRKFLVDRSVIPSFENHIAIQHPPMDPYMPPAQPWGHPQRPPPNAGFDSYYAGNPRFTPQGPHDNFYPPPDLPPFEKPSHHGMSTYGQDAAHVGAHSSMNRQPPPLASQGPHHMQIPIAYADAVIGSAGANISYIRRTSGAAVIIQESRGAPGEMTVEISGSSTQVQTAQQLIQNFMAGAGAAAPGPATGQSPMPPVDQGYGYAYGPPAHAGGGYDSSYGGNYGY